MTKVSPLHLCFALGQRMKLSNVVAFIIAILGCTSLAAEGIEFDDDGIILAIHSYHSGYDWTDRQIDGLSAAVSRVDAGSRIFHEYMDSKRIDNSDDYADFIGYLMTKYRNQKIAVLVVTDDHALKCVVKFRVAVDARIPIFHSGVTALGKDWLPDVPNSTGVLELFDLSDTVDFALTHFNRTKHIFVLLESTLTGDLLWQGIQTQLEVPDGVELNRLPDLSFEKQLDYIDTLPADSIVVMTTYRKDPNGTILDQSEAAQAVAERSRVPVFITYRFGICEGMVGGKVLDPFAMGYRLGLHLKSFLEGTSISNLPVVDENVRTWVFSQKGLKKFRLNQAVLPEGADLLFVDDQPMFRHLIVGFVALLFILIEGLLIFKLLVRKRRLMDLTAELQESKNDLSSWITHAPLPVSIFNHRGEVKAINYQYSELLGYDVSDFRDAEQMWSILIQDEFFRLQFLGEWRRFCASEVESGVLPKEVSVRSKSGSPKVLEIHASRIGEYFVCFYNDVTWRSQIEIDLEHALDEASNASEAKTQFLTNMSHEIRTPLNGVLGMSQLLADTDMDSEQRLFLDTIHKSGEMLLLTINDILDLSKIESGQLALEDIDYGFRDCIEKSIAVCLPKLNKDLVQFISNIDSNVPDRLRGDDYRVSQVIVNLLSNAFKYTETGKVELGVSVKDISDDRVEVSLRVEDTGIGISEEKQQLIFEPFSQADTSNTRQYGGTGLGLTICKEVARMMDGEVSLESEPGQGSVFLFKWISSVPDLVEGSIVVDSSLAEEEEVRHYDIRTLVVEDNTVNFKVIELSLAKIGIKPVWAKNGLEAVSMLKEESFELVFMDIQMPVMDGLTATTVVRKDLPKEEQPFIIALTAHALADHVDQCREVHMNGFLSKPFNHEDLKGGILLYLEEKKSDRWKSFF